MHHPNFCAECGAQLKRKSWRVWKSRGFCDECAGRLGNKYFSRSLALVAIIAISAFGVGRLLRPPPPPLVIQRAANSPLSDLAVNFDEHSQKGSGGEAKPTSNTLSAASSADDIVYICGARTKKGTPCRRRVHSAGERCFQHKGMPSLLPLEKLAIK